MKKSWRNNVEFYLIGLLVLTVAAFSITMPEIFWSISNFQSVASQMPVLGILALAMAVTMLCGGINLSIIATANAGSMIGGIPETQEMLDFCAEHGIVADIEMIRADQINEAYERMLRGDVKYRFVIDNRTLTD
ncbi:hypothetical protein E5152_004625 [Escherichia coli]|nr:hypothetical protein [Escherichia coli]EEU5910282.1 hypothetical protein [Escherichia coli]